MENGKSKITSSQDQSMQENCSPISPMGIKKNSALSCISLPLFSFDDYNINKESQPDVLSSSNTNLNSSKLNEKYLETKLTNSLVQTEPVDLIKTNVASQKDQKDLKEISNSQISSLIKESQKVIFFTRHLIC